MYHETIRPLYAYVSQRVGGDVSLAEDLVQETWMRALDDWAKKGIPREPLAWLRRVALNTLVSHFRRIRLQPIAMESLDIGNEFLPTNPDDAAAVGWAMARLRRSRVALKKKLDQIRRKPAASPRRNMEVKYVKPARTR